MSGLCKVALSSSVYCSCMLGLRETSPRALALLRWHPPLLLCHLLLPQSTFLLSPALESLPSHLTHVYPCRQLLAPLSSHHVLLCGSGLYSDVRRSSTVMEMAGVGELHNGLVEPWGRMWNHTSEVWEVLQEITCKHTQTHTSAWKQTHKHKPATTDSLRSSPLGIGWHSSSVSLCRRFFYSH